MVYNYHNTYEYYRNKRKSLPDIWNKMAADMSILVQYGNQILL
jgi:hypothetical protein